MNKILKVQVFSFMKLTMGYKLRQVYLVWIILLSRIQILLIIVRIMLHNQEEEAILNLLNQIRQTDQIQATFLALVRFMGVKAMVVMDLPEGRMHIYVAIILEVCITTQEDHILEDILVVMVKKISECQRDKSMIIFTKINELLFLVFKTLKRKQQNQIHKQTQVK